MRTIHLSVFLITVLLFSCEKTTGSTTRNEGSKEELIFTKHAKCRMDCRHISEDEIRDILANGRKNGSKSKPNGKPCPTTALEGVTSDQQEVRIIVAECEPVRKIVTVIDLGTDWSCDCK